MIKNYLTLAIRNFLQHKVFSLINILGLALGISAALVIYLIVQYEFSFEQFRKDKDLIYRVVSKIEFPDLTIHNGGVPVPVAAAIRKEATGVELASHFITTYPQTVSISQPENQAPVAFKNQDKIMYADNYYFQIFDYSWLAGSPLVALKDPFQVVLTQSRAESYFGNLPPANILGKTIIYEDSIRVSVSGIIKDVDDITDFNFKELISSSTLEQTSLKSRWSWDNWGSINSASQLFVKLSKGTSPAGIENQLVSIRDKHRTKDAVNKEDDTRHFLQPLLDLHFNKDYSSFGSDTRQANKSILWSLLAVALFILALGCINFINLSTAQAAYRAKEIGIRKTLGGAKSTLIFQFLSETFLFTLLATFLSILLAPWLLNIFQDFIPKGVSISSINQVHVWLFLSVLVIVVTLFSGFYPALVLSNFKPVTILKNQTFENGSTTGKTWLRKTLTVSQFVITQVLLIATLVLSKQIHYSIHKELGYKKEAIVFINTEWNIFSKTKDTRRFAFVEKIKSMPEIEAVSLGSDPPASANTNSTTMKFNNEKTVSETMVETKHADPGYFDIYNIKLVAGSNLVSSDTTKEYIINETYAKLLGFKDPREAVGKFIERSRRNIPIKGVVSDFHTKSTHQAIKPLAYSSALNNSYTVHLALQPQRDDPELWKRGLAKIEKEYKTLFPDDYFKYTFFDESIASFYKTEQNIIRLLKWSSGLCVLISCLGLLGLVIYTTSIRTKEIGVRKVLGASVLQILTLITKDFILLVILAFAIAIPISWWGVHRWLQNFEYRVQVGWLLYFAVCVSAILIAMSTIGFQAMKAALANPIKSLRTE